jgi:predicted RNase H-like nuclease (RuvC/YqgF family)
MKWAKDIATLIRQELESPKYNREPLNIRKHDSREAIIYEILSNTLADSESLELVENMGSQIDELRATLKEKQTEIHRLRDELTSCSVALEEERENNHFGGPMPETEGQL